MTREITFKIIIPLNEVMLKRTIIHEIDKNAFKK